MIHIVESCPLTGFADGDLFWLHFANDGAVTWLQDVGSEGNREMKKHGIARYLKCLLKKTSQTPETAHFHNCLKLSAVWVY